MSLDVGAILMETTPPPSDADLHAVVCTTHVSLVVARSSLIWKSENCPVISEWMQFRVTTFITGDLLNSLDVVLGTGQELILYLKKFYAALPIWKSLGPAI
jgi:hypothetical protein